MANIKLTTSRSGSELGLAVERPANNLDIDRIWRMDL